jgi:HD-like signal output (HDOD) protein/GGDEF domain-containing protein
MSHPPAPFDRFLARAGQLYSLPAVAFQVLELTANPRVDTRALKECIENDPALVTKILRVVNSSLFGLAREVSDLNQAIALLGAKPLKLLVLGFSLPDRLFVGMAAGVLNQYWRHTLTQAVAARELARTFWRRDGDEAFITGLLADLGMLLLLQELGEPYVTFLEQVRGAGGDVADLERTALGFDHFELTARLLDAWGLPPAIVLGIGARHLPENIAALGDRERPVAQILHLARLLSQMLVDARQNLLPEVLYWAQHYRGLAADEIDDFVGELQTKVEQLADVLSLTLSAGVQYTDVLAAAHTQLAAVAGDVAPDVVRAERGRRDGKELEEALLEQTQTLAAALSLFNGPQPSEDSPRDPATSVQPPGTLAVPLPNQPAFPPGRAKVPPRTGALIVDNSEITDCVQIAVSTCRQARTALSLLLVELDDPTDLVLRHGPEIARKFSGLLAAACSSTSHPQARCVAWGDGRCALVLPACDRGLAVELATTLLRGTRQLSAARNDLPLISVSVGVATLSLPPKNFPAHELIDAAHRCLGAAKACGGNSLKSIGL